MIARCGNNYGPRQYPEKFLPLMICNALNDQTIPIYGDGLKNAYDYLTTNPVNGIDYTATSIHLISLPSQRWVSTDSEGNNKRALTVFEYANYTLGGSDCEHSYHCSLQIRNNVSGFDSAFGTGYTTRGNATGSTRSVFVNGSTTGSIFSTSQYDILGNVVRLIEPRSTTGNIIATTFEYDDRFGSPDGDGRANSVPGEVGGASTFAMPTKVIDALGHTTYTQYDYYLGTSSERSSRIGYK